MNLLVSAAAALGLVLMFSGITAPAERRRAGISASLDRLVAEAAWTHMTGSRLAVLCLATGWLSATVAAAATQSGLLALLAAAAGGIFPVSRARRRRDLRHRSIAQLWPDAISSIVAGIRAGMALPECCTALARTGPEDLRPAFGALSVTYTATGSFEAGLQRLREELQEPITDRVVAVLRMTHQVGGNDIVRVLRATSEMVREDGRIRAEVVARWSWTIAAAKVAAAAPFIVLALMSMRPEGAAAYTSPAGATTVGVGVVATWIGYRLMLRAGRLPEDTRLNQ